MCRLCRNISSPRNGLVLNDTFTCFPPEMLSTIDSCLYSASRVRLTDIADCGGSVLSGNSRVSAKYNYTKSSAGDLSLRFLAMAFRSTTQPSGSATENIVQYDRWEAFLQSEMDDIRAQSGQGGRYEGAWDIIQHTFQASDYWVQINTEIIAIRGSFYGILISIILCAIVVAILSRNGPVVLAMGLTILGILVTLLGLFELFGWTLGIIEAVSLSILVGNSLDYCIHLSEGYVATDQRHLHFLSRFQFTEAATPRVKRVLSAISFIGVSIISSALTTFLATIPLLGAKILLFTRFAQILILDTAVAILYTLLFCGTFLSLFGPLGASRVLWRVFNPILTIGGTVLLMIVIFFVSTHIMSQFNII
jgi:PERQ amino acid-rich with GYF domain-containing protein